MRTSQIEFVAFDGFVFGVQLGCVIILLISLLVIFYMNRGHENEG